MAQLLTKIRKEFSELFREPAGGLQSGQSLMEVLISITIVTIVIGSSVGAILLTASNNTQNRATELATGYEQELMGNMRSIAQSNWSQVYNLPTKGTGGMYYLATYQQLAGTVGITNGSASVNGVNTHFDTTLVAGDNITINSVPLVVSVVNSATLLTLTTTSTITTSSLAIYRNFSIRTGQETIAANNLTFKRWFSVQNVFRDTCGTGAISTATATACTIATSTGALTGILQDPSTQQVTVYITWSNNQGAYKVTQDISRTRDQVIRFNDWSGGAITNSSTVFTQPTNQFSTETGLLATSTGLLQLQ